MSDEASLDFEISKSTDEVSWPGGINVTFLSHDFMMHGLGWVARWTATIIL